MVLPSSARRALLAAVTACAIGLGGCVTPVEVKTASKKQLELIDSLDRATSELEAALAAFHRSNQDLIRNQARVAIARQSIDVALQGRSENVTADQLFRSYNDKVRPWIDYAFAEPRIAQHIEALKIQMAATSNVSEQLSIRNELDDLKTLQAKIRTKPAEVAKLEAIFADELTAEAASIESLDRVFTVLRQQIATMKAAQQRVDAWLSIDVSVSQEQIDSLTESFRTAQKALAGGSQ
jgi:exonuclease VII small subunit